MELIGVIPAAGVGSRLYPYAAAKETLPVGSQNVVIDGKTYVQPKIVSEYIIEQMAKAGVKKIFIVTRAGKQDLLRQHMDGSKYGVNIVYIIGEPQSMVHSIDLAYEWIKSAQVVMGMPDTIAQPSDGLRYLLEKHAVSGATISLGLYPTDNPSKFGMITTDQDDSVITHEDKPASTTATEMWGIATWEPSFTEQLHSYAGTNNVEGREAVFGDVIEEAMKHPGDCKAFTIPDGHYYDIGTYDEYKKAIEEL